MYIFKRASLVAQMVKIPPAMQETWVQSLSWEDPLEEGRATLSILAGYSPWDFPGKSTGVGCHCLLLNTYLGILKSYFLNGGFMLMYGKTNTIL